MRLTYLVMDSERLFDEVCMEDNSKTIRSLEISSTGAYVSECSGGSLFGVFDYDSGMFWLDRTPTESLSGLCNVSGSNEVYSSDSYSDIDNNDEWYNPFATSI